MSKEPNLYAKRDPMDLDKKGDHYYKHINHMTREDLHSKSDIACELAYRDIRIEELEAKLETERKKRKALKRYWTMQHEVVIDENIKLQNVLDKARAAWANRLLYKDESGIVSVMLHDAAILVDALEDKP